MSGTSVELRVLVISSDERENTGDRLEEAARKALGRVFGDQVYVEQVTKVNR